VIGHTRRPLFGSGVAIVLALVLAAPASASPGPGKLDRTFGRRGAVLLAFPNEPAAYGYDVAIQPDGRIVVVGEVDHGNFRYDLAVARLLPDGRPDASFGSGGEVVTDVGDAYARSVAIQPDGKIVVGGTTQLGGSSPRFLLVRYLPDGSLDPSFGDQGVSVSFFGYVEDIAVGPDGTIVAAGGSMSAFSVARFLSDGSPDPGFGQGGEVTTPFGQAGGHPTSVIVQPDGSIVAGGWKGQYYQAFALARYLPDGTPDPTFGSKGVVVTKAGRIAGIQAIALQSDGSIVCAAFSSIRVFTVVRYRLDGTLDATFGRGGFASARMRSGEPTSIAVEPDGDIVAGGLIDDQAGGRRLAVAAFRPSGSRDPAFGGDGLVVTDLFPDAYPPIYQAANGIAIDADGRVVVAGEAHISPDGMLVARYLGA